MSRAPRIVVVNKDTVLERYQAAGATGDTLAGLPDGYREGLARAHRRHQSALALLKGALDELGWSYEVVSRDEPWRSAGCDLVVSLGGDGTVLMASHRTFGVPLLGINSDPERSTGYFCAVTAEQSREVLQAFEAGSLEQFTLQRLRLEVDGREAGPPALNDVLVANTNPAATSRYVLVAGTREELQKSSGIWISTPAGSTAGIRSAGGVVLPLGNGQLQYLVREPVSSPAQKYELLRGVRSLDEGLTVISHMHEGCAYVDGPFVQVPLPVGATLRISVHQPLTLLGLHPDRRER